MQIGFTALDIAIAQGRRNAKQVNARNISPSVHELEAVRAKNSPLTAKDHKSFKFSSAKS